MLDREYPEQEAFASHHSLEDAEGATNSRGPAGEFSFVEIASALLRHRIRVLRAILLFTSISLAIALTRPTLYTSSASFFAESSEPSATGALALAQQFGFALGSAEGERSPQFYADLVTSTEILRQVVTQRYSLSPTEDGSETIDLITHYEIDEDTDEGRIERAIESLSEDLSVDAAVETGVVSFSVTTSDPKLSQGVAAHILALLNDFDLTTRQSQAGAERMFSGERLAQLTSELREAEDSLKNFLLENRLFSNSPSLQFDHDRLQRAVMMRQELVTSLAQAFENARIEEVRNIPIITLIETPRAPGLRDREGRVLIVSLGMMFGAMFGILLALLRHYNEQSDVNEVRRLEELSLLWSDSMTDLRRFVSRPFKRSVR